MPHAPPPSFSIPQTNSYKKKIKESQPHKKTKSIKGEVKKLTCESILKFKIKMVTTDLNQHSFK